MSDAVRVLTIAAVKCDVVDEELQMPASSQGAVIYRRAGNTRRYAKTE